MSEVTRILSAIEQGDSHAAEQLLPLVYDELRALATAKLANEKPGQTLQATALTATAMAWTAAWQNQECPARSFFLTSTAMADAIRLNTL